MENYSETDTFYIREKRKEEILKKKLFTCYNITQQRTVNIKN